MPVSADFTAKTLLKGKTTEAKGITRWWLCSEKEDSEMPLHEAVQSVAARIHHNLSSRRRQNYIYSMMYNDIDTNVYATQASNTLSEKSNADSSVHNRITLNIIQNCVDTAASMIATNRPKPTFRTDGIDDYSTYIKADKLTKYVAGVVDDLKLYNLMERVFVDGAVYGTGAIKFYPDYDSGKIAAEWCYQGEILIDDLEALKETPSQLHQRKYISRDVLIDQYPEFEKEIVECSTDLKAGLSQRTLADVIPVIESWHMKSGVKAKDGLHCITIENATLFSEKYEKDYYPIVFWRWYHQTSGFWGRGIAQEISKIQRTINKIMRTIDQSQEMFSVPIIVVPKTANIPEDHLTSNEIGVVLEYYGEVPPQFMTPPAVNQELYSYLETLKQDAYNIVGINQNMAQGQKDAGLKSGVAIREANDVASGRFQMIGQRWEDKFNEIAEVIVDISADLFKDNKNLSVKVDDGEGLQTIKWKDVNMERDRFKIKCFAESALPSTPAGRLETLSEWASNGWIDQEMFMSLANIPDIKRYSNLETSTYDLTQATVSKIKEEDLYTPEMKPIPQMNLQAALKIATMEVVRAKIQMLPQSVMDKLDLYLQDLNYLLTLAQPPAPPQSPDQSGNPNDQGQTPTPPQ